MVISINTLNAGMNRDIFSVNITNKDTLINNIMNHNNDDGQLRHIYTIQAFNDHIQIGGNGRSSNVAILANSSITFSSITFINDNVQIIGGNANNLNVEINNEHADMDS